MKKRNRQCEVLSVVEGIDNNISSLSEELFKPMVQTRISNGKTLVATATLADNVNILNLIQQGCDVVDMSNIKISFDDFLDKDFGEESFGTIIANPPFTTVGVKFIDKMVNLLEDGGRLICVMSSTQFMEPKGKLGTFRNLITRGSFTFIQSVRAFSPQDSFNGRTDWCWFVFDKKEADQLTTLISRDGSEFQMDLTTQPKRWTIPQLENEDDYFDWDEGLVVSAGMVNTGDSKKYDYTLGYTRKDRVIFIDVEAGEASPMNGSVIKGTTAQDLYERFEGLEDWYLLYGTASKLGSLRCPPFKVN